MAITTIDGALAGAKPPQFFTKAVGGTMVAGRAHSFWQIAGLPGAAAVPGSSVSVTSSSVANPTVITTATHGLATGDQVSIIGHTGSSPAISGNYTVTVLSSTTFTIPVNVTVGGTGGICSALNGTAGSRTPGLKGAALTSYQGQIPFTNPASGNTYISKFQAAATVSGTLLLCDRLWHNTGIHPTITTEQTFTDSEQIPARDDNGQNVGRGVYAGIECQSALGNGTPTITFKYVNTLGNTVTATNIMATANTPTLGDVFLIGGAAECSCVQRAVSYTASGTYTSGQIGVFLYRILAAVELTSALVPNAVDALTGGFPRVYDNTVPFLMFIPSTTTSSNVLGHIIWSQG